MFYIGRNTVKKKKKGFDWSKRRTSTHSSCFFWIRLSQQPKAHERLFSLSLSLLPSSLSPSSLLSPPLYIGSFHSVISIASPSPSSRSHREEHWRRVLQRRRRWRRAPPDAVCVSLARAHAHTLIYTGARPTPAAYSALRRRSRPLCECHGTKQRFTRAAHQGLPGVPGCNFEIKKSRISFQGAMTLTST